MANRIIMDKLFRQILSSHYITVCPTFATKRWATTVSARTTLIPSSGIRVIMGKAWEREAQGKKVYHLEVGQPDQPAPHHAVEAAKEALNDVTAHRYIQGPGETETREVVARHIEGKTGCATTLDQIVVTPGAVTAISTSLATLVDPGDEILLPDPGWPNYTMQAHALSAVPVPYPCGSASNWLPDMDKLRELVTPKTRVLMICNPSNPVGNLIPQSHVDTMLKFAKDHNLFVLSDEIYSDIVYDGREHVSALSSPEFESMQESILMVSGVSKAYSMTGFRMGYVRAPAHVQKEIVKLQEVFVSCGVPFAQRAARAALSGPQECVGKAKDAYERRRDIVMRVLGEEGLSPEYTSSGAFYMLLRCGRDGEKDNSYDVAIELLEKYGVAVAPGATFGKGGENFIRISFATSDEDVEEGVRRIARHLKSIGMD
eukprot:m.43731 g.43731  ORF g.43731 m.43731 type:complete len:430 (+) comp10001_c0_seq2:221-1510(+)